MAASESSDVSDGPVLSLLNKRLRALRKKLNRILQMEDSIAQGKPINKEQEEVLRSKPAVSVLIDELEKLRQPLSQAVSEELSIAAQRQQLSSHSAASSVERENSTDEDDDHRGKNAEPDLGVAEDVLKLLYFGSLFDVKSQNDFTATILTRTHERGCCLTYDYVTDDDTDLLGERDLNSLSSLSGLLTSRPVDSGLSHKNALQRCIEHAKLWLANSEQPIEPNANITYAGLRERLNKIMASDYFTTTPEMKYPVEVAAAAAGNYTSFHVPITAPTQEDCSVAEFQHTDQESANFQRHEIGDDEYSAVDELQKDEELTENAEVVSVQQEQIDSVAELEHNEIDPQSRGQQYIPRRTYQNLRGGRGGSGGGRWGYSNGRGGGRGRSGPYQSGRNQYYEQPGNYYPRNFYNNRGRGGRAGGPSYNNHGSAVQSGHTPADIGDQDSTNFQRHEIGDDEYSPVDELQKDEELTENAEVVSVQQEQIDSVAELEHNEIDPQSRGQQYIPRRTYQNLRGGRGGSGGGRWGYSNGRGGGRGRSGPYQSGRNQYYEQPGNYYPRNFYNNRGRGGRAGGPSYNNHGSAVQSGHTPADIGVRS